MYNFTNIPREVILLDIELRFLHFEGKLMQVFSRLDPNLLLFVKKFKSNLDRSTEYLSKFSVDKILEKEEIDILLGEIYKTNLDILTELGRYAANFTEDISELLVMLSLFYKLDYAKDRLIMEFNCVELNDLRISKNLKLFFAILKDSPAKLEDFTHDVNEFSKSAEYSSILPMILQYFFEDLYFKAYEMEAQIILLECWHSTLIKNMQQIAISHSENSFGKAYANKNLLDMKDQLFISSFSYANRNNSKVHFQLLKTIFDVFNAFSKNTQNFSKELLIEHLQDYLFDLQRKINAAEKKLQNCTAWQSLSVNILRIWTKAHGYQIASQYTDFVQELYQKIGWEPMVPMVATICAGIGSVALPVVLLYLFGTNTVKYMLFSSLGNNLFPRVELLLNYGKILGYSKEMMIDVGIPIAKSVFSFGTYLSFNMLMSGCDFGFIRFCLINYLICSSSGTLGEYFVSQFFEGNNKHKSIVKEIGVAEKAVNLFVKYPTHLVASTVGSRCITPVAVDFTNSFFRQLPANDQIEHAYKVKVVTIPAANDFNLEELGIRCFPNSNLAQI